MKKIQTISNLISIILVAGYIIFLLVTWKSIPDIVPTHFNFSGNADSYGSKNTLIFIPIIMIAVFTLIAVSERFPGTWHFPVEITDENREQLFQIGTYMLAAIKLLIVCLFIYIGSSCIYIGLPVWILYALLAAVLLVVIIGTAKCIKLK